MQGRFHEDKSGARYGMLTLIERVDKAYVNGTYAYLARCDCGTVKTVGYSQVSRGHVKSCGCLQRRKGADSPRYKHGIAIAKGTEEHKRYQRECYDRFKYGLEPEQKAAILANQSGCCAICGYQFGQHVGDMHVDHDHLSGDVRGLLCDLCNRGLGYFKDNPNRLTAASFYLAR